MAYSDLSKKAIKSQNYGKDVPFLLSTTPSVVMSSDAGTGIGYTNIHVRGTDPTRINITSNGIPMNDAESNQLYWVNMADFASSVESMQIQRGVGTSTNGAGAFGATVNMQTENIGTKPFGSFDMSGGSYYSHKETFRFGTGLIGNHWGFQGRLSNIRSKGYIDRASSNLGSYFLQGGYFSDNTAIKFITFNGQEKTYQAWNYASKAEMEKYGRRYNSCGQYKDANGNVAYYDNQTDNYHQQHYQLILNQILSKDWTLNAALHYTKGHGYYEQYKADSDDSHVKLYKYLLSTNKKDYSDLIRQKIMDNDFYGAVASVNYDNRHGLRANIGGGVNEYKGSHYGKVIWVRKPVQTIDPGSKYYDNNATKKDGNIYAKVDYEFLPGLNAFADLQFRYVSFKSEGSSTEFAGVGQQIPLTFNNKYKFFNPKFGINYDINQNNTLYISYGIAHKEPTRNDFENELAISDANKVEPKSERLNDLEVGYKYQSPIFSAGANFYRMDYDNQFVLTGAQDENGEMVARNIKKSYRMGLELMAAVNPFKGFNWNINATISKNRAKDVDVTVIDENWANAGTVNVGQTHLSFSPDFILNNIFSFEYRGLTASLVSKYVGEQYMTNTNVRSFKDQNNKDISTMLDKYFVTDLDISYTFHIKGLKSITLGATVYNLFNEEYESNGACALYFTKDSIGNAQPYHAYGWSMSTYSAQAPTNFMVHLSINF